MNEGVTVQPRVLIADNLPLEVVNKLDHIKTVKNPENVDVLVFYDAPAGNFISAEIQKKLILFAKKHGLRFQQGHGIGYYNLLDDLKKEEMVISYGENNSIFGSEGIAGIHVAAEEILKVLEVGSFSYQQPEVCKIELSGGEADEEECKNACMKFIMDHKETLQNKCLLLETKDEISAKKRQDVCQILGKSGCANVMFKASDANTDMSLSLKEREKYLALPGSFENISSLKEVEGTRVQACFIGGCTGGSIEDLRLTAKIWEGKRLPIEVRVTIAPVNNQVFSQAIEEGLIEKFIDNGAQILNAGCGSCRTTSKGVIGSGEIMISTGLCNYKGCSGEKDSQVYLASTDVVAQSALKGYICGGK